MIGSGLLNLLALPFIVETARMRAIGLLGAMVLIISGALWLISFAYWEIRVAGEAIHYKSLVRNRRMTFRDIKRASTLNHETRFYSREGRKLFSLMPHDRGYDLFINCLKVRNISIASYAS